MHLEDKMEFNVDNEPEITKENVLFIIENSISVMEVSIHQRKDRLQNISKDEDKWAVIYQKARATYEDCLSFLSKEFKLKTYNDYLGI